MMFITSDVYFLDLIFHFALLHDISIVFIVLLENFSSVFDSLCSFIFGLGGLRLGCVLLFS